MDFKHQIPTPSPSPNPHVAHRKKLLSCLSLPTVLSVLTVQSLRTWILAVCSRRPAPHAPFSTPRGAFLARSAPPLAPSLSSPLARSKSRSAPSRPLGAGLGDPVMSFKCTKPSSSSSRTRLRSRPRDRKLGMVCAPPGGVPVMGALMLLLLLLVAREGPVRLFCVTVRTLPVARARRRGQKAGMEAVTMPMWTSMLVQMQVET